MKIYSLALAALLWALPVFATETQIVDDVIQISTGGPLINPASNGVLNLRTKESDATYSSGSDAYSVYVQTGETNVEGGISGMIRLITGPAADSITDGYTGNAELGTSASKGSGFSGDVVLSAGPNPDVADNGGRVRLLGIRTMNESGYFQLYKSNGPPSGVTVEESDMYYDIGDHKVKVYNGTAWKSLREQ